MSCSNRKNKMPDGPEGGQRVRSLVQELEPRLSLRPTPSRPSNSSTRRSSGEATTGAPRPSYSRASSSTDRSRAPSTPPIPPTPKWPAEGNLPHSQSGDPLRPFEFIKSMLNSSATKNHFRNEASDGPRNQRNESNARGIPNIRIHEQREDGDAKSLDEPQSDQDLPGWFDKKISSIRDKGQDAFDVVCEACDDAFDLTMLALSNVGVNVDGLCCACAKLPFE